MLNLQAVRLSEDGVCGMLKKIELQDREIIMPYLKKSDFRTCEYNFANNFGWQELLDYRYCISDGFCIIGSFAEDVSFLYPAGDGDIRKAVEIMRRESRRAGVPLSILSLTEENLQLMREYYGDSFDAVSEPVYSDYIYDSHELADPKGNRGRKCRKFERDYAGRFEFRKIKSYEDYENCIHLAACQYNIREKNKTAVYEQLAIHKFFMNFEKLEMEGVMLYIDGRLCAFSGGSAINSDTFDCNMEKADRTVSDMAYTLIFRELARTICSRFRYLNKEEDLGLPGLIKAKNDLHPVKKMDKWDITFR